MKREIKRRRSLIMLDRDGVITVESGDYIIKPDDVRLIPYSSKAIKMLNAEGIKVVLISNQAGVGKGEMTETELNDVQAEIERQLSEEGAWFDGVYYCTDSDDTSDCRKPNPGMLIRALNDYSVVSDDAWMVGDNERDILAGDRALVGKVLLLSGSTKIKDIKDMEVQPDYIFPDLLWFVRWMLG